MIISSCILSVLACLPFQNPMQNSSAPASNAATTAWAPPEVELVGMFFKENATRWRYEDLRDNEDRGAKLAVGSKITLSLKNAVNLKVLQTGGSQTREFNVIVSSFDATEAQFEVKSSGVHLVAGWGYLIGSMPYGETTRTTAAADGSGVLIAVAADGASDEIAYATKGNASKVTLVHRSITLTEDIQTVGNYRTANSGGYSAEAATSGNAALLAKQVEAKKRAAEAEIE